MEYTELIQSKINEILTTWSEKQIEEAKSILQSDSKIAKGLLINSLIAKLEENGVIITFEGYGQYVSDGRASGKQPPTKDIEDWCEVKGIPVEMAYPIARSIGQKGIAGDGWIDKIMESIDELSAQLAQAIGQEICIGIKESLENQK